MCKGLISAQGSIYGRVGAKCEAFLREQKPQSGWISSLLLSESCLKLNQGNWGELRMFTGSDWSGIVWGFDVRINQRRRRWQKWGIGERGVVVMTKKECLQEEGGSLTMALHCFPLTRLLKDASTFHTSLDFILMHFKCFVLVQLFVKRLQNLFVLSISNNHDNDVISF